jgi:ATP-binding cassette ChvD family protein
MSKLSKTYQGADKPVLKNIYLSFFYGAKIGILGLNGSGKSSLLKIIAGVDKNYQGDVVFAPGYTVGYLEQEPILDDSKTVIEIVREGVAETMAVLDEFNKINDSFGLPEVYENADKMEQLMDRQALLQDKIDALGAWEIDTKLEIAMDALRTPEGDTPIKNLSGGERRRVALCRLLLQQPDVLLLDEPTNHLDAESVLWLEQHLAQYSGTVIAVTHDRYFLDNVAGWILELDRGEGIPWKGNYSSWLEQKSGRMALEEKTASKRRKNLERELDWVRQGAKGRQIKQKARLQNYDKLLNEDQKQLDENLEIYIPNGPRLGTNVIEAKNVSKAFGDKLLYDNLNFTLPQAGIVGIIGPNGAGKSTIFKMIMGEEKPDSGEFLIGDTVKIAYVDQAHSNINPEKSIWENFADGQELIMMGGKQVNSRAYLSRFNFGGGEQNKKVSMLSGGERNRLHLAMTLKEEGNVLLLDEPTNDLDINTLRALEEGLENFAGCAVVISHDRWFLDRICTHILAFEGNSEVYYFEGGFTDYEENKKKRLGGDLTPKRLKYRKLIRS